MKKLLILLTVLVPWMAQAQFGFSKHDIGIRGGYMVTDLLYSDPRYANYGHDPMFDYSAGITSRHRIKGDWTLRTDLVYAGRGGHLHWCDVDYQFALKYFDLRLPVQYNFDIPWHDLSPFIAIGPMVNIAHMGTINYSSDPTGSISIPVDRGSAKWFDIGVLAMVGLDLPFDIARRTFYFTIEAGYGYGLVNNFSRPERRGESTVVNTDMDEMSHYGARHNHGAELAVSFSVPLQKRRPKRSLPSQAYKTMIETEREEEEDEPVVVEVRDCYTIDDIVRYLDAGIDVSGFKICLFDINFDFDKFDLNEGVRDNLKKFARVMQEYPDMRISVYGHTDSLGSDEYNIRLSNNRAKEVRSYIGSRGIDLARIGYKGFGESQPIESNSTEWGRHRNRRVEIVIHNVGKKRSNNNESEDE